MKIRKNIKSIFQKKKTFKRQVDLLLRGKEGKRYYVLIIHYTTEKKNFCGYCLQAFSTAEILKSHVYDFNCFNYF